MKSSELLERHALANGVPVYVYSRYQEEDKKKESASGEKEQKEKEIDQDEQCCITVLLPRVGSWLDPANAFGTAHFREHIGYQGTMHCPSFDALAAVFDSCSDWPDAHTSQTYTEYILRCKTEQLLRLLPVFAEIITAPLINEESTAHEREIIAAEYREDHINRRRAYLEDYLRALHGDHPLNHSAIGTPDSIQRMTPATLAEFQRRYYHAGNLTLICTGNLPPTNQLIPHLEAAYGTLTCLPSADPIPLPPPPYGREIELHHPEFRIDSICISFPMARPDPRSRVAWETFGRYLGGDKQNPIGYVLREKNRLIYSGIGLSRFHLEPHFCGLQFNLPLQRAHFAAAFRTIRESAEELTETRWEAYRDRKKRRSHPRRDKPFSHAYANQRIKQALYLGEQPADALAQEVTLEQLNWSDIDACRNQLLATKPFIFRALA